MKKLIVITKETFFEGEALWINALLDRGVHYVHLRKPGSTCEELECLLRKIDMLYYARIVLHDHFALAVKYHLGGVHLNSRNQTAPQGFGGRISRSCHTLEEVVLYKDKCSYVTLSPIFDSISKSGYNSAFSKSTLLDAQKEGIIDDKVVALGGIQPENVKSVCRMGFGGVALLGSVWSEKNICRAADVCRNIQLQMDFSELCEDMPGKVLSIAGSDPSGGAGIQADIKTITSLDGYAATAITALTVQNTEGVRSVFASPEDVVYDQIGAVMEDIMPQAVKIGMVKDVDIVKAIVCSMRKFLPKYIVYDPVMVATSGDKLIDDDTISIIEQELIPLATLITPNKSEAEVLWGNKISDMADMDRAAGDLCNKYNVNVLVKGGHLDGELMCDVLGYMDNEDGARKILHFNGKRIDTNNLHGTGCTLSSAIATFLAKGFSLCNAVEIAKKYLTDAIERGSLLKIGHGNGPLWHNVYSNIDRMGLFEK